MSEGKPIIPRVHDILSMSEACKQAAGKRRLTVKMTKHFFGAVAKCGYHGEKITECDDGDVLVSINPQHFEGKFYEVRG